MKRLLLLVFLISLMSFTLQAEWVSLGGFKGEEPEIKVLKDRGSSITIEFKLQGYSIEQVDVNGRTCSRILLPGQVTFLKQGLPELPTIVRNIIIPDDGLMDYRIVSIEYETKYVNAIIPSKGNLLRNVNPDDIPYTFDKFYQTSSQWPENTIEIYEPFILRDYRGLSVRFNPFQYNPARNELKIVRSIVVEVYEIGKGGKNVLLRKKDTITREFVNIYESIFLNFGYWRYPSISEYAGRMLIITADGYQSNMADFVTWKKQKGIDTKIVPISSIGNNQTNIKNYIQNEYNAGDLVWVLLVGDGNEVVPATGTIGAASGADADPVYAYTAGGDYYPDIFISRFSSRGNATNIDKQVSRSIYYEKTPETGADWYHIGLGVASDQGSPSDKQRCNWLRDSLLLYHYTSVDSSYDPWGTSAIIKSKIEAGVSIIDYIGHGGTTGWINGGGFDISDINNLNNPWMLPFVLSVACVVGNFNGSDCYCEASVTAGTVNQPDGFLVHWGSTINQSWVPPCYGQEGAVNLLTHDAKNTAGGIFFNGACYMIEYYGSTDPEGIEMAQTWHIFGDASVQLRTDTPQSMTVNHNSIIYFGTTTFDVTVVGVEDALCALFRNDTLYGAAYTNASGFATINIDPPLNTPGDVIFTVTAYNKIPYIVTVPVQASSGPYIAFLRGIINDTGGGNGNGEVNPGEIINFPTWVINIGSETANNVYGFLSTTDGYTSVTQDSSYFGTITAGDSALGTLEYVFDVASNCPDMHNIDFDLTVHDAAGTTWVSTFQIPVYAPDIVYDGHVVDDAGGSNPNGVLDPGETADLLVTLKNDGHADAANITATLSTSDSYITINDNSGFYGDITVGASVTNTSDPYTITAIVSTPQGHIVHFTLAITGDYGFVDTTYFDLMVGLPGEPYADHDIGNVIFTVTSHGSCGFMDDGQSQGSGFKYPYNGANSLFIGSVWVGNSSSYVVNTDFSAEGSPDWEVTTIPDGLVRMGGTYYSNQDGWAMYDDAGMSSPKDIIVTQNSWAWANDPYDDFVIMVYTVENKGSSAVNGIYVGHFMDVDITAYNDYGARNTSLRLVYVYEPGGVYVGAKLLEPTTATNLFILNNATYVYPNAYILDSDKIQMLNGGIQNASGSNDDWSLMASAGPYDIAPGECILVAFAIIGGDNLTNLENNAGKAQWKYDSLNVGIEEEVEVILPTSYYLSGAYPNPANQLSIIDYQLPVKSQVSLQVYDVSGRLVDVLVDGVVEAGYHSMRLDTKRYASGVYFYRLAAGGRTFTKKMIVVK